MAGPVREALDPFFGAFLGWDRAAAKIAPEKRVILGGQNLRTSKSKSTSCSGREREGRLVSALGSGVGTSSHHCWEVEPGVLSSHSKLGFFTALDPQSSTSGLVWE